MESCSIFCAGALTWSPTLPRKQYRGSQGIYVSDMIIEWNHSTEAARLSEEREKMVVQ
jgi:hypothetical protein